MIGGLAPEDVESGTKECIVLLRPASDRSEGRRGEGEGSQQVLIHLSSLPSLPSIPSINTT